MPPSDDIKIVKCTRTDLLKILNLVVELAIFENEPKAVTANLKDYQTAYDEGIFDVIVAKKNDEIIGMSLFYMTFSTWKGKMMYLEDFFVMKPYRKLGVGQKLFDAFIDYSKKSGCKLAKWQVLDWNKVGLNFYEKNNAIIEKEWWNGKIIFNT